MRRAKVYPQITKQIMRPEIKYCLECGRHLRRCSVMRRAIVTLKEVISLVHYGYRCPHLLCQGHARIYRSALAEGLALPGFTFGLDVVLLAGALRLHHHRTIDEVHQELLERLAPMEVTISRREILFLFETYATLLRAATEVTHDQDWRAQALLNGGLLLSIDGIQPDKGNETIYLVRDLLTGRLLAAENVTSTRTEVIKELLMPVKALEIPVLGVISDAQDSQRRAIADLWPDVPHQICQFHALREASRPLYEFDHSLRTQVRKHLQKKLWSFRTALQRRISHTEAREAHQFHILDAYAAAIQAASYSEGIAPFEYAAIKMDTLLTHIQESLQRLEKKGRL